MIKEISTKPKLSILSRSLRWTLGIVMTTWLFIGGPFWNLIGLYLLFSATYGFCPVTNYLKK